MISMRMLVIKVLTIFSPTRIMKHKATNFKAQPKAKLTKLNTIKRVCLNTAKTMEMEPKTKIKSTDR